MPRDLTITTLEAFTAQTTQTAFPKLLIFSIDEAGDGNWKCLHIADYPVDVVSTVADGVTPQTYLSFPVQFDLPGSLVGQISSVTLAVDNCDRELIEYILAVPVPIVVTLYVVSSTEPNTIITKHPGYTWRNLTAVGNSISGRLTLEDFLNEPYPGELMAPYNFPGVFS